MNNSLRLLKLVVVTIVVVIGAISIIGCPPGGGGGDGDDDTDTIDNSNFYGTYNVTSTIGNCDPDEFILTIGNDESLRDSEGYLYVPQTESSYSTSEGTISVSGNTISIDMVDDEGFTTDLELVFDEDYNSWALSGTITTDDSEECSGTVAGSATTWVFNKVSFPVTVRAEIDGVSQLKIKGSIIWWHHIGWEPPDEISLNDEDWYPIWPGGEEELTDCDCDSSSLDALETPLREDSTIVSIDVVSARGEVEIVQQPNLGNDYTAVIEFDDHVDGSFPGSDMYEIIISYDDGNNGGSQSLTVTGASGNPVNLNGTWDSGCDADIDDGESETWVLTVSGSSFSQINNEWLDSITCNGTSDITLNISGTVMLGDELTATMGGGNVTATENDYVFTSITGTANNLTAATGLNNDNACGFNDWVAGVPKDVMGTSCFPDSSGKDILFIDDLASPDVWYSGDEEGAIDVNGYPAAIDSDTAKERV